MSEICDYFKSELIITGLKAETKEDAIRLLVDRIMDESGSSFGAGTTAEDVYEKVMAREEMHTTGIGNGLAFPHARMKRCSDFAIAMGVLAEGIDFKSVDGKPCEIVCVMVTAADNPYHILQAMAVMSRFFLEEGNISKVKGEFSPEKICKALKGNVVSTTKLILAADLMRPVQQYVRLGTSIEETAKIMHLNRFDILPVVDDENNLCGEISCLSIFNYGIPDFFSQLHTVSFVRHLDPFEKYFKYQKSLKVKDLYEPLVPSIQSDTTLMEIIFQITAKNRAKLYVVKDGKLTGVIDRFSIIDKVLFF